MKRGNLSLSIAVAIVVIMTIMIRGSFAQTASNDIKALFSAQKTFSHVEALVNIGPRVVGTAAEQEAAEYITNQLLTYGYDVEIQEFETPYFEELSPPELEQISPNPTSYIEDTDFATMTYSSSGDVTAPIQAVDLLMPPTGGSTSGCEASDFAGFPAGNIALIQRGTCYYAEKALNAENAGAVGVIIFNEGNSSDRMGIPYGTLGGLGVSIPVVGASFALGQELYNLLSAGDVTFHMKVDAVSENRTSRNIIGTKEGLDPSQGIVYMGAHYDTVSVSPGANDNASGVAALLEAARIMSLRGYTKATQKFIAFGAYEVGLDGSYNYVNENYDEVSTMGIGMFNLDMIAVGDTLRIGNTAGDASGIKDYTGAKATAMGLEWVPFVAGLYDGDQIYFEIVGVPSVYIQQYPDPNYHTAEDTLDKIDIATLEKNGELATAVMYDWAKNPALRTKKGAE